MKTNNSTVQDHKCDDLAYRVVGLPISQYPLFCPADLSPPDKVARSAIGEGGDQGGGQEGNDRKQDRRGAWERIRSKHASGLHDPDPHARKSWRISGWVS